MRKNLKYIFGTLVLAATLWACTDDEGTYSYLSEKEIGIIEIDTTGIANRNAFSMQYNPEDVVKLSPKVKYENPKNLKFAWIAYPYPYEEVAVGNAMKFPVPDTLGRSLEIEWTVNLEPGRYTAWLLVEDPERGLTASMQMGGYFTVNKPGVKAGVYMLSEYDGKTDIDYYASSLCLIFGGDSKIPHYYSEVCEGGMLPGKPKFISYGKDYYYVFTETNGYRLNTSWLMLMEEFADMFYDAPTYAPQKLNYINNCEFLINDGKLHMLYTNKANDRKFSPAISGDYAAGTYLSDRTRATTGIVSGAIGSDQVIFDTKSLGFRPYFPQAVEIAEFNTTSPDAFINAKKLPAQPLAMQGGDGGKTYAIVMVDGTPYLYIMNFYNVVDNGDLSSGGAKSKIDLSGCKDIANLKYFVANVNGTAFFYATDKGVYSFTPSSGQTKSETIYECPSNEIVTCIDIFARTAGGAPTFGNVLWVAAWDETAKDGKLIEYEIDPYSGLPRWQYGSMFTSGHTNPQITTGFGKIKSITVKF